ncbi:MAG: hypothetical protein LBQ75_05300 [Zoogloeaceae bacterium]|nr:hypothetical protein [Zoogloeaceae bacterium]
MRDAIEFVRRGGNLPPARPAAREVFQMAKKWRVLPSARPAARTTRRPCHVRVHGRFRQAQPSTVPMVFQLSSTGHACKANCRSLDA